jgi:hypothetical protein
LEAGVTEEQALGALAATSDQKLRQRLPAGIGGANEELSVPALEAKAEALAIDFRSFVSVAGHEINVHTSFFIGTARRLNDPV